MTSIEERAEITPVEADKVDFITVPQVRKPVYGQGSVLPYTEAELMQADTNSYEIAYWYGLALLAGGPMDLSADYKLTYDRDGTPKEWNDEDTIIYSHADPRDPNKRLSFDLREVSDTNPALAHALIQIAQIKLRQYGDNGGGFIYDTDLSSK